MKFELDEKHKKKLKATKAKNNVRNFFLNKDYLTFTVGDVLIKKTSYEENFNKAKIEQISPCNKMPQRYVVVEKDEFGICYLMKLRSSDGLLSDKVFCITDFNYEYTRFQVDPEYAECSLLDSEFNIQDIHKKSQEAQKLATEINRKSGVRCSSLLDVHNFFQTLKCGDVFYESDSFTGRRVDECTILSIEKVFHTKLNAYEARCFHEVFKGGCADDFIYKIILKEDPSFNINSYEYCETYSILFKDKPAQPSSN